MGWTRGVRSPLISDAGFLDSRGSGCMIGKNLFEKNDIMRSNEFFVGKIINTLSTFAKWLTSEDAFFTL